MARRPIIDRDEARTAARAKASDPTNAESGSNEAAGFESITIEPSGSAPDTETAEIKLYNVDSGPPHDDEPVEFDLPAGFNDDAISGPAAQAAALNADLVNLRKDEDDAQSDTAQGGDTFGPDSAITREQMAKLVTLEYELPDADHELEFDDTTSTGDWADTTRGDFANWTVAAAGLSADMPSEPAFSDTEGHSDDIISGPAAQAAALKADLANLRKDEDEAKSDIAQDEASGIDTNALDDTLGKTLDASTEQGGAPKDAELAAPFVPGGAVLSVGDAPDEDDPKANDIEDA